MSETDGIKSTIREIIEDSESDLKNIETCEEMYKESIRMYAEQSTKSTKKNLKMCKNHLIEQYRCYRNELQEKVYRISYYLQQYDTDEEE